MTHPYQQYQETAVWRAVDDAITALVGNKDLQETTARAYIVGYICQQLDYAKVLRETPA